MNRLAPRLLCASLAVTAAIGACSTTSTHRLATGGEASSGGSGGSISSTSSTSTGGATATGGAASTGGAGGSVVDAGTDAPWDSGGVPFDCGGCTCDSATHMCLGVKGGSPPPPYGIDCNEDGGPSNCVPIPPECLPDPTCSCIKANSQYCGTCSVYDGGFHVDCLVP